jgi:hypothetical protein
LKWIGWGHLECIGWLLERIGVHSEIQGQGVLMMLKKTDFQPSQTSGAF